MGNILYIDCFSGISGDMMAAAFLDLGLDFEKLEESLKKINIRDYHIEAEKEIVNSLATRNFKVTYSNQPLRNYRDIKKLFSESSLEPKIKGDCLDLFNILAEAEARVHNCLPGEVHFHEIGAVDSIIDIVATAIGFNWLGAEKIYCSKVPLGSGFAKTMHGIIPVPAPATLEILKGLPAYQGTFNFEVTTPTGAAIVKKYAHTFGLMPQGIILDSGMGAGSRKGTDVPNILRLISLKSIQTEKIQKLRLLTANIDDLSPEIMAYVSDKLLKQGALDVWIENILMKKGRPAFKICLICPTYLEAELADILFAQTTTLGIRSNGFKRHVLDRRSEAVDLDYGKAHIKLGLREGRVITAQPEYDSCMKLAEKVGRPLKEVYDDVKKFYLKKMHKIN